MSRPNETRREWRIRSLRTDTAISYGTDVLKAREMVGYLKPANVVLEWREVGPWAPDDGRMK